MSEPFSDILARSIPDSRTVIVLGPVTLVCAALAAAAVGYLRVKKNVKTAYTRKIFHFVIFTMAGIVDIFWQLSGVMLFGAIVASCVLYAVWRGNGFPFYEAMARPSDHPRRTLFIIIPLLTTAAGGLLSNFLFPHFAYAGYLVCGWGDAIAEPVGAAWGKHPYRVPSLAGVPAQRSLEGSLAVFVLGTLAAFAGLAAHGVPSNTAILHALACGLVGALVEAVSNHGLDNLTIQVAVSGTAHLLGAQAS